MILAKYMWVSMYRFMEPKTKFLDPFTCQLHAKKKKKKKCPFRFYFTPSDACSKSWKGIKFLILPFQEKPCCQPQNVTVSGPLSCPLHVDPSWGARSLSVWHPYPICPGTLPEPRCGSVCKLRKKIWASTGCPVHEIWTSAKDFGYP